jgi:hypothetical protein
MGAKDQKKISKKKMLIGKRPDTFTIYKVTIEEGVQYKDAAYICYIQRCCIHLLYTKMLHTFAIYKDVAYICYIQRCCIHLQYTKSQ